MASESFFNNTTFFHTTYGMFHFNPDSGNSPILLLFSSYKFFSLRFFWGMHTSMTFVCGAKPHNPKVSDTKQVVLYAMSFFTTISYGREIHQVSSMYGGEFLKEGESTYWLKAGSFQTGRHGVSEEDWSSGILNIKNI